MERDQDQRDRQREGLERSQEQAKEREPSRGERAFVGTCIERCERQLSETKPHVTTGRTAEGEKAKDLEDRFQKDRQVVWGIEGIQPEKWAKASFEERVQTLRDVERRLADSQGRESRRVYSVGLDKPDEERDRLVGRNRTVSSEASHATGFTEGRYIHIKEGLLRDDPTTGHKSEAREVLAVMFEESRHAYQHSALNHKNRHSEVDDSVREKWQYGMDNYPSDVKNQHKYKNSYLEQDAQAYAKRMTNEVYG